MSSERHSGDRKHLTAIKVKAQLAVPLLCYYSWLLTLPLLVLVKAWYQPPMLPGLMQQRKKERNFASDNNSGICPEAWEAMTLANQGHSPAYGFDSYTAEAQKQICEIFETDCESFLTFTGSAANCLAVAQLCRSHEAVICHESAHLDLGECGGPEFFSGGAKVISTSGDNGQLHPAGVEQVVLARSGDFQYPRVGAVSVTQAAEMGTVYSLDHLRKLVELSHFLGLHVHMDGARFANALVRLGCSAADMTWRVGIDVLSFGGTKNGLAVGEAVVFFNKELAQSFNYRWKQAGQVASKMRFLAAPWVGFLKSGAWLRNARHANACAGRLAAGLRDLEGVSLVFPCEANSVFLAIDPWLAESLARRGWQMAAMPNKTTRLVCSWDTRDTDIEELLQDFRELVSKVQATRKVQDTRYKQIPNHKHQPGNRSQTARTRRTLDTRRFEIWCLEFETCLYLVSCILYLVICSAQPCGT